MILWYKYRAGPAPSSTVLSKFKSSTAWCILTPGIVRALGDIRVWLDAVVVAVVPESSAGDRDVVLTVLVCLRMSLPL